MQVDDAGDNLRKRRSNGVFLWMAVAVLVPLELLVVLRRWPVLDALWDNHPAHFWLVLAAAAIAVALGHRVTELRLKAARQLVATAAAREVDDRVEWLHSRSRAPSRMPLPSAHESPESARSVARRTGRASIADLGGPQREPHRRAARDRLCGRWDCAARRPPRAPIWEIGTQRESPSD